MSKIIVPTRIGGSSDSAPRGCTLPLWLVFILQSLVVIVSFIAVILVLSLQQEVQYRDSVFREIELQLQRTSTSLTGPILERERVHTQMARRLELDTSLRFQVGDSIFSPNIQRFLNLSFFTMYEDPLAYSVFQHRLHPTLRLPASSPNGPLMYGASGFTKELHSGASNYNGTLTVAPNPSFPLQFTSTINVPLEMSDQSWSASVRGVLSPQWLGVGIFYNPLTDVTEIVSSLAHPLEFDTALGVASLSIAYAINVRYLVGLTEQAILTPATKGILVHRYKDDIIASVNTGAALFNPDIQKAWKLYDFPDRAFIAGFNETDKLCSYHNNCTSYAQQKDASIISLVYITTHYGYTMSFYQITPRDHYFAVGERAITIGIVIGVVAAVVVLVSCVVIWVAVRRPVRQLRESMQLAAQMRNDEVRDTSSLLTELDQLSLSFIQMNDKLLQARAFMPQALLLVTSANICDDDDNETLHSEDDDDAFESGFAEQLRGSLVSMPSGGEGLVSDFPSAGTSLNIEGSSPIPKNRGALEQSGNSEFSSFQSSSAHPNECQVLPGAKTIIVRRKSTNSKHVSSPSIHELGMTTALRSSGNQHNNNTSPTPSHSSLVQRKVAVLVVNARGTHDLANSAGSIALEREQVRLVELVERCARSEKGVVDSFHGDHFVLTFNAVRAVGAPGRNATIVGLGIREGARRDGLALGQFSMGLSVGRALVGNVGSTTMKRTCTVGTVYPNAVGLERLAKRVGHACVVHGRALGEVSIVSHCLALGTVAFSGGESDDLWGIMYSNEGKKCGSGGSGSSNVVGGGNAHEWLYEMAEASETNPFNVYNKAVLAATSGSLQEALTTLALIPPPPAVVLVDGSNSRSMGSITVVNSSYPNYRSGSLLIDSSSFVRANQNSILEMATTLRTLISTTISSSQSVGNAEEGGRVMGRVPTILLYEV